MQYLTHGQTAVAIKWAFIGAVFLLFLLWFVGGYYHAQRRIKRGLPPLRYHRVCSQRWAIDRHSLKFCSSSSQHDSARCTCADRNSVAITHNTMATVKATPCKHIRHHLQVRFKTWYLKYEADSTAYHTENIPPPSYQPPQGGTKVNPTQEWAVPPPGPPPGYAGEGSSTMQSVPLNPASIGQQNLASEAPKKPGMMARLNPFK